MKQLAAALLASCFIAGFAAAAEPASPAPAASASVAPAASPPAGTADTTRTPTAPAEKPAPRGAPKSNAEATLARPGRAPETEASDVSRTPFGSGTRVEITALKGKLRVFVAPLPESRLQSLDATTFRELGHTPLVAELPPGRYRIEAESFEISNGRTDITVTRQKSHLEINPGSEDLALTGSLLMGLGGACFFGAAIVYFGGSTVTRKGPHDGAIALGLAGGGLALGVSGYALRSGGQTTIEARAPSAAASPLGLHYAGSF